MECSPASDTVMLLKLVLHLEVVPCVPGCRSRCSRSIVSGWKWPYRLCTCTVIETLSYVDRQKERQDSPGQRKTKDKDKDPNGIGQSTGKARLHAFVLRGFSRDVFGLCDPLHRTGPVVCR